jgi:hypothetical protein
MQYDISSDSGLGEKEVMAREEVRSREEEEKRVPCNDDIFCFPLFCLGGGVAVTGWTGEAVGEA